MQSDHSSTSSSNSALIGGIVGGVIALLLIIALIVALILVRRRRSAAETRLSNDNDIAIAPIPPAIDQDSNYGSISAASSVSGDYNNAFLVRAADMAQNYTAGNLTM
jgi:hypothetical protein